MITYGLIFNFLLLQMAVGLVGIYLPRLLAPAHGHVVPIQIITHLTVAGSILCLGISLMALYGENGPFNAIRPPHWPLHVTKLTYGIEFWGMGVATALYGLLLQLLSHGGKRLKIAEFEDLSVEKIVVWALLACLVARGSMMIVAGADPANLNLGTGPSGGIMLHAYGPANAFWLALPTTMTLCAILTPVFAITGIGGPEDHPFDGFLKFAFRKPA